MHKLEIALANMKLQMVVCLAYCLIAQACAANTYHRDLCSMVETLGNSQLPLRADGYTECPSTFSANLIKMQDGTMYGACFRAITAHNASYDGWKFRAMDCRKRCSEFGGASLLTLQN